MKFSWFLVLILLLNIMFSCKSEENRTLLFVGSFTNKKLGNGISVYEFDNKTGEARLKFVVDSIINTSFLRLAPNGKTIYSVVESQMDYPGKVATFSIDSLEYKLSLISMHSCGGRNPAHLEIDKKGQYLVNSNYTDPSVSIFKIKGDGSLKPYHQLIIFKDSSIIKGRQESAHIHSSTFSPESKFLFTQDLGSDKIRRFTLEVDNDTSLLLRNEYQTKMKPGSGPRHFTFHPNGKYAYGISELSGKVTAYSYKNGVLEYLEDYLSYTKLQDIYRAADIHISPDGKFLYTSNRGPDEDSISIFSINIDDGTLMMVGQESTYGEHPRNFAVDPSGNFLLVANQFSNNITIFRRDSSTGKLTKLPQEIYIDNPASIQMRTYKVYN